MRRNRRKPAVSPLRWNRGILLGGDETNVVELQRLQVNRFLNQVTVFVADVLELRRRHAHIKRAARGMPVPRRFEPGFKGLADDLLFECCQNLEPGVEYGSL